jgi:hypothetical protein
MAKRGSGKDFEVGYGKPPKAHQFQPGQSGNPKGRPKGSPSTESVLEKIMAQKMTITEGDERRVISRQEGLLLVAVKMAMKGDRHYAKMLLDWMAKVDAGRAAAEMLQASTEASSSAAQDAELAPLGLDRLSTPELLKIMEAIRILEGLQEIGRPDLVLPPTGPAEPFVKLRTVASTPAEKPIWEEEGYDVDEHGFPIKEDAPSKD